MNNERILCVGIRGSVEELKKILADESSKYIKEVFVGAPPEMGNTGRFKVHPTTIESLEEITRLTHASGIECNIVLNTACLGRNDINPEYLTKIKEFVIQLEKIDADYITLGHSALIRTTNEVRKKLKINVSTYLGVNNPLLAKEFENMGVARITLPQTVNRDLQMIERIKKYVGVDLEVFANTKCVNGGHCAYRTAHQNFKSHQPQLNPECWENVKDPYTFGYCGVRRRTNMIDVLFTPTIRPEDVRFYENIGVPLFKLATRMDKPETVIKLVRAYGERRFDGPFGELWTVDKKQDSPQNKLLDGLFESVKDLPEEEQLEHYKSFIKEKGL